MYRKVDKEVLKELQDILPPDSIVVGEDQLEPYCHDETPQLDFKPEVALRPRSSSEVSDIVRLALRRNIPLTPRGGGTGLSGGALPVFGGIVVSFEKMNEIKEIDKDLIPTDEFVKRNMQFMKKFGTELLAAQQMIRNNKTSWGTVIELSAEKYAEKIAIKFEDSTITYKEFNEQINRYAHYFISMGLKKGDVVELVMANRPEYLIIVTAIGKIGAITSLINIDLRESSLKHCLKLTPGKFIIVGENCFNIFTIFNIIVIKFVIFLWKCKICLKDTT